MDAQNVKDFTGLITAVRRAMDEYLYSGDLHGAACAAGTLTSRINNLNTIVAAYETREPNQKDRFEVSSLASTLAWLQSDKDVIRDFAEIKIRLPETDFEKAHPVIGRVGEIGALDALHMLHRVL